MDRFSKDFVLLASLLAVAGTVLWYFVVAIRASRLFSRSQPDEFLRYRGDRPDSLPALNSELLHASLMGSAFSLASSIYAYLNWAATDGAFVLWSPILWAAGALVLYRLRHRVFRESRSSWTLHGFLESKYQSATVKRLASLVTTVVFLLQVVAEVYVGLAVLQVFFEGRASLLVLCLVAGTVFVGYSVIGGLPAIMLTDHLKYRLTALSLLVAGIALFDQGGASAATRVVDSLRTSFLPSSTSSWLLVVSLAALNLPLFITDMSVWQRIGAARDESEVRKGLGRFALVLLPWLAMIVFVGIGFGSYLAPPEGWTTAQAIISFFSDSLVFALLLAGLFAALLTTADNFLIASVQTVLVDWVWSRRLASVDFHPERLEPQTQIAMLRTARIGTFVLGIGAVGLGYLLLTSLPSLLDLLFVIFGLQTALTAVVLTGLRNQARPSDSPAAIASIISGTATGLLCLLLALGGVELFSLSIGLLSPLFVLGVSSLAFFVIRPRRAASSS